MIAVGSDHAGFKLKMKIIEYLSILGLAIKDHGTFSSERADYPKFAHAVADHVASMEGVTGILVCGSANGVAMSANKHEGIRCAVCWTEEIAQLARAHNDANIIAIPARFIEVGEALRAVEAFRNTTFEGGRHRQRVDQIPR